MAIGPIGNAIFVNQQTASVASIQNSHNNRIDFQNMVAQVTMQEKDEKVIEVRPAEENHEVDEDKEHERDEADRENQRSKKKESEDEENLESVYKLDIKV
jgi:hypothetical protein